VQDSFAKALQATETFRGGDVRSWVLAIVRNTAMNFLARRAPAQQVAWTDDMTEAVETRPDPESQMIEKSRRDQLRAAIAQLAPEFREALVLREFEGLAYKEIAAILRVPIGTVMSRLSRARNLLLQQLAGEKGGVA
jgi:RNA polymerase sigma-70 factor (ECF subfamily)